MTAHPRPAVLRPGSRLSGALRLWAALGLLVGLMSAVLVVGTAVLTPSPACACDCAPPTIGQAAARADTVFTGTLVDIESTAKPGVLAYTVRADRVYKGSLVGTEATFTSRASKPTCGLGKLPVDEQYVVFVSGAAGSWTAEACGGTTRLDGNTQRRVAAVLGAGKALHEPEGEPLAVDFTPVDSAPPPALAELVRVPAAVSLGGLVVLALAGLLGRKRT